MKTKRTTPIRLCVGCGERDSTSQLVRFTVREGGKVVLGIGNGRGGYLHPRQKCVRAFASSRSGFVRSLRIVMSRETREFCAALFEQNVMLRPSK